MKKVLYVGLEAPRRDDVCVIHCPLIEVVPKRGRELKDISRASHVIVTSKTAVACIKEERVWDKAFISVGKATTGALLRAGARCVETAVNECQEGIIELLETMQFENPLFFWGHSSRSRPLILDYLHEKGYRLISCVLYETHFKEPEQALALETVDEIHFTSPSTVEAFFHFFGPPPKRATLHTQGPITQKCLSSLSS